MMDDLYEHLQKTKENKSLLKKYFTPKILNPVMDNITPTYESNLGHCMFIGCNMHDCVIGLNAPDPEVYTVYNTLFDAVIKDYHKLKPKEEICQPSSFFGSVTDLECSNLDPEGEFIVATRVQINRCLEGHGFANILTPEVRAELEIKLKEALSSLTGDLKGTYYSIESLSLELRAELAEHHLLFDNNDKYLEANGVYRDWPNYRGIFVNHAKTFVAWVNGEDHLQIFTAQEGTNIADAYKLMVNAIQQLNRKLSFVKDERLGYLTYYPSNVGTGLHAVVHMKLPHLAMNKNFGSICEKLKLTAESLQKVPMEGVDTLYAVSNKRTVGVTEIEVMCEMVASVLELIKLEKAAAEGKGESKCTIS